jgi:hypothetical protein
MKKLFLMMGLACLFMVACNNAPKQQEPANEPETTVAEEHHCPFCTLKAEYANWDNMEETAKAELNKKAYDLFAEMDAKMAEMKAEGKECCEKAGEMKEGCEKKMAEMTEEAKAECQKKCEEMKAECEAMKAAWEAFETKTLDEQKDLVLGRIAAMGMGEGKCGNHEAEEHHCNHEGEEGHQCQHGEGHQCQHEAK